MDNDKDVDRDGSPFDTPPEDTAPIWMLDDVDLSVQRIRDDDERWRNSSNLTMVRRLPSGAACVATVT